MCLRIQHGRFWPEMLSAPSVYNRYELWRQKMTESLNEWFYESTQKKPSGPCWFNFQLVGFQGSGHQIPLVELAIQVLHTYSNYIFFIIMIVRRKFRSQTSDNMERWKAEQGRGREKRKIRREKIRRERVRRQKIQMREKVGKSRNTVFFQWFVAPEGRKVGSLKRRVRSQLATGAMKNCAPLWREAHFEVKSVKNWRSRTTFGSWDVKKVHAIVARSIFPSQNVQNTPLSDHFWKLRCRKSAHRCGAKHISKSKCTKHTRSGPLLEVAMSKKCTPLWREAHFEVKMYKTHHARTTFGGSDVEKVYAVVARSTFRSQNVQNTRVSDHFWRFRCWKKVYAVVARRTLRSHTTLQYITPPVHSTTLNYTTPHYITLNDTATQIDR